MKIVNKYIGYSLMLDKFIIIYHTGLDMNAYFIKYDNGDIAFISEEDANKLMESARGRVSINETTRIY